jgi:hypothetical protein
LNWFFKKEIFEGVAIKSSFDIKFTFLNGVLSEMYQILKKNP